MTGALFLVGRMEYARDIGRAAIDLREQRGEPESMGEVLTQLGPILWSAAHSDEALIAGARSVELLRTDGQSQRLTFALLYWGLLLSAVGQLTDLPRVADETLAMAEAVGVPDLIAMAHALHGRADLLTGNPDGIDEIERGLRGAIAANNHVFATMCYVLLVQDQWDLGRFDAVDRVLQEGLEYARTKEVDFYVEHLLAHQAKLFGLRGNWAAAEESLRELVGTHAGAEPASLRYSLPALAILATRRDAADADESMSWCQDFALRAGGYYDIIPSSLVAIEAAWLSGRPELATNPIAAVLSYDGKGLQARHRGEVHRWLRRLGRPAEAFPGCPEVFASGLRADWRAAAAIWAEIGSPYHRALELVDSGDIEATLEALQIFDSLGSPPAVQIARRRLRDLGVSQVPRGPKPATRTNPAGLTDRQVESLTMLSAGSTNAEITAQLVVSVRTVDHHVSAVLQKLGLTSRRQAAKAAADLGPGPHRFRPPLTRCARGAQAASVAESLG